MVPFYQPEPPFSWPYLRFQFPGQQPAPPMMNATNTFTSLSSFLADRSPFGSILRIEILSTWRASRFVALDRIQFVDPLGRVIPSSYCRLFSDPLPLDDDGRPYRHKIEGLVVNRTDSPEKSWKPWRSLYLDSSAVREGSASLRNKRSSLFVLFDTPVMIAFMRIWNCHDVEEWRAKKVRVTLDDFVLFVGELSFLRANERDYQTILFVNGIGLLEKEGEPRREERT
ncbi:uncharacterized protein [Blastocystis hominis]|uniref:KATNIP domain-containing protein n=1 Tax=Blastocystis hominis TaxID=12968 RepID=D8M487_BLAHO|nr:uncharacterized protein [Blastocystis hominis]CBK22876.2 unnamed protein product [Blastocystis hominis]|eukprot:XP_012896924.1 uncharacterized protein [Blastocystis hominis]